MAQKSLHWGFESMEIIQNITDYQRLTILNIYKAGSRPHQISNHVKIKSKIHSIIIFSQPNLVYDVN